MIETPTTKEIVTNAAVGRLVMKTKVVDIPSLEYVMKKSDEVISGLFFKCMMEM